eukprot:gene11433-13512_t
MAEVTDDDDIIRRGARVESTMLALSHDITHSSLQQPSQWRQKSADVMKRARKQRDKSEIHRFTYHKYVEETHHAQYSKQLQVNTALKNKRATLELLIEKLQGKYSAGVPVVNTLEEIKAKVASEMEEKQRLLDRNTERQQIRKERPKEELVADEAHRQLLAQESLLKDALRQTSQLYSEITKMLEQLMEVQASLQEDLNDKKHALELNTKAEMECPEPHLKEKTVPSPKLYHHRGALNLDTDVRVDFSRPQTAMLASLNSWHGACMKNVENGKRSQKKTLTLCDGSEKLLKKHADAIQQAHHYVSKALQERINELQHMANDLRQQLSLTMEEIEDAESTTQMLQGALDNIQEPLKICENRRNLHSARPKREMIEDVVQRDLKVEASDLMEQNEYLVQRKHKLSLLMEDLMETKADIERDIERKEKCVTLDQKCLELGSY